jgi:catechol 2,3-dioxygenase-like lactoylglutathione lyase family enzyme
VPEPKVVAWVNVKIYCLRREASMKVKSLDRIEIMVRDMDKAVELFSKKLGMEFKEMSKEISARDGVRCFVCHETHLHLISPILPLPENAPPPIKKMVELLKEKETIFVGLMFKVHEPAKAAADLEQQGIHIQHRYKESHDYVSIGMDNFAQVVADDKDTFGIVMGFSKYDRV